MRSIVIYLHYADDCDEGAIDKYSGEILNSEKTHTLFKEHYNKNNHNLTEIVLNNITVLPKEANKNSNILA